MNNIQVRVRLLLSEPFPYLLYGLFVFNFNYLLNFYILKFLSLLYTLQLFLKQYGAVQSGVLISRQIHFVLILSIDVAGHSCFLE